MTKRRSDAKRKAEPEQPSSAWEAMLASPARRPVEQVGGPPMASGPGMWRDVPPPVPDLPKVVAQTIKDQERGCDCRPLKGIDGTTTHEHFCSWWDLHPEATPF